ncbi:hypothetical protein BJY01DRAFT_246588 [Aspergillus pseudoustus]|uniref:Uncharacterized protein n=1 Tax=Aspergillus pseudoustus TaxID=1810923 RepID=A0ABR4K684_9EURO
MPCEDLSKLCPDCLNRASVLSDPIGREYIPVNSLRVPKATMPVRFDAEMTTANTFDIRVAGESIGRQLAAKLEPYLKVGRSSKIRRFHMWIRTTTADAERATSAQKSSRVLISLLFDVQPTEQRSYENLAENLALNIPTTFSNASGGFELAVGAWASKTMNAVDHDHPSAFRLRWFSNLHSSQPGCVPYMIWSNFPPLKYGEYRPARVIELPWFIYREEHPTTTTRKPAGAA